MDLYSVLEVDKSATPEDIKKAYRRLSKKYHPDLNSGDKVSEEKFKEINEAYSVLSDPDKRRSYDNPNHNPFGDMFNGFPGFGGFDGFSGFSQQMRKPDLNGPKDGTHIVVETSIPLNSYIFGDVLKTNINYDEGCGACGGKGFTDSEECSQCHGIGFIQQVERRQNFMSSSSVPCPKCRGMGAIGKDTCSSCSGVGNQHRSKEFTFNIQPFSNPGTKVALMGQGRAGLNGGRDGDVVLVINGIQRPDMDRLSAEELDQLKAMLLKLNG